MVRNVDQTCMRRKSHRKNLADLKLTIEGPDIRSHDFSVKIDGQRGVQQPERVSGRDTQRLPVKRAIVGSVRCPERRVLRQVRRRKRMREDVVREDRTDDPLEHLLLVVVMVVRDQLFEGSEGLYGAEFGVCGGDAGFEILRRNVFVAVVTMLAFGRTLKSLVRGSEERQAERIQSIRLMHCNGTHKRTLQTNRSGC